MKKLVVLILIFTFILTLPLTANAASDDNDDFVQLFNEHGAVMLLIDDTSGDILYANEAAASFYGYSKQKLETMNITQINTLSPEETETEIKAAVSEERNYFIFKHRLASGDVRSVEVYSYPVTYEGRKCLFSIVHDITDKVLLEQRQEDTWTAFSVIGGIVIIVLIILLVVISADHRKLRKSKKEIESINELRRTFYDADESLVYLKDDNLKYVFVNKALEEFYQKKSDEIIGMNDFELSDVAFAALRRKTDEAVMEKRIRLVDEVSWNGHIYQTVKFPVKMPGGCFGVGAYIRDITQQRLREIKQKKALVRNKILVNVISKSFSSRQEQLDYVLLEAIKLTESKLGYLLVYDEASRSFKINSWSKNAMQECAITDRETQHHMDTAGVLGDVVLQKKPVIINDFKMSSFEQKGHPAGHVQLFRFLSIPVVIDDRIVAVVGLGNKESDYDDMDVSELTLLMNGAWNALERKAAQDRLILERNKYWQTIVSIGDGVMVVDRQGRIEMLNTVAQTLTGWTQEDAVGRGYQEVFLLSHEDDGEEIADPVQAVFDTDQIQELGNSAILTSKDGKRYNLEDSAAPIKDENGTTVGVVLVFRDVTYKKEQRRRIEFLSYHDSLTGLYNRRFFEESVMRLDTQRNLPISIIMGDVNGLKLTNDIFGHAFGDALLQKVSEVFKSMCRADDIIARWGGDEFVVLLPKTTQDETKGVMDRIKEGFAKVQIKAIKGSISLGSHTKTVDDESIVEALDKAEGAMYIRKTVEREAVKGDTIKEIISQLHHSHPEEKGHADRVGALSYRMGKLLRLSEAEASKLKFGGLLHDIGKISLLPSLTGTAKPEISDRKEHATVGYRILRSFDDTLDLAEAALYHHERWDGAGYPKGLKGQELPLIARVVAVADYYDKLTHPAPGTQAKTSEEAVRIIEDNAGTRFDPQIVNLFVKMIRADESSRS